MTTLNPYLACPKKDLKKKVQQDMWDSIVHSYPANYFNRGDAGLLVGYVRATVLLDKAWKRIEDTGGISDDEVDPGMRVFKEMTTLQTSLATKLRIAPNGRYRPEDGNTASNKAKSGKSFDGASTDWRDQQTQTTERVQ